jgi:hypothetical protein
LAIPNRRGEREKGRKGEGEKGRKGEREKGRRGEGEKGRRGEGEKGRRGEGEKGRRGEGVQRFAHRRASVVVYEIVMATKRHIRWPAVLMVLLLSTFVFNSGLLAQSSDEAAIQKLVESYFAAYAKEDLDAITQMWSEKSPDLAQTKARLKELLGGLYCGRERKLANCNNCLGVSGVERVSLRSV